MGRSPRSPPRGFGVLLGPVGHGLAEEVLGPGGDRLFSPLPKLCDGRPLQLVIAGVPGQQDRLRHPGRLVVGRGAGPDPAPVDMGVGQQKHAEVVAISDAVQGRTPALRDGSRCLGCERGSDGGPGIAGALGDVGRIHRTRRSWMVDPNVHAAEALHLLAQSRVVCEGRPAESGPVGAVLPDQTPGAGLLGVQLWSPSRAPCSGPAPAKADFTHRWPGRGPCRRRTGARGRAHRARAHSGDRLDGYRRALAAHQDAAPPRRVDPAIAEAAERQTAALRALTGRTASR